MLTRLLMLIPPALLLAGCRSGDDLETESESATQTPVEVRAANARLETLRPVAELTGTIVAVPERVAYIAPQTTGQVDRLMAEEGTRVRAGDPIVLLDMRAAAADQAKARAGLEEARAALALLERGPLSEEVEAVRQDVVTAASEAAAMRAKVEALEPLHAAKEIAPVQFEQAKAASSAAEATRAAAEARLQMVRRGSRPEAIAEARARLASAQAEAAARDLGVALCTLASPIDGTVTELTARRGMSVQASDRLAMVTDLSVVFIRFRLPADLLDRVADGTAVEAVPSGSHDAPVPGEVKRIAKTADPQSGEVEAFALLPNPDGRLKPGSACRLRIAMPESADVLVVPAKAVADHDGKSVVTVIRDGKAYESAIVTGVRTPESVQILDGLSAGDVVALEGGYALPDGCPVTVSSPKSAS